MGEGGGGRDVRMGREEGGEGLEQPKEVVRK